MSVHRLQVLLALVVGIGIGYLVFPGRIQSELAGPSVLSSSHSSAPATAASSAPLPSGDAPAELDDGSAVKRMLGDGSRAWLRSTLLRHAGTLDPGLVVEDTADATHAAPSEPLLGIVGAHVNAAGVAARARMRATFSALRARENELHLVFVVAIRDLDAGSLEALAQELEREGDILLIGRHHCPELPHSKAPAHFAILWQLFGNRGYHFFVKIDTDTLLLPQPYAAVLRSLVPVPAAPSSALIYGGCYYLNGNYVFNQGYSFMTGGAYFMSSALASHVNSTCAPCFTEEYSAPEAVARRPGALTDPGPGCWRCHYVVGGMGEDVTLARLLQSLEPDVTPQLVRLNAFHGVIIGMNPSGSATRLRQCLADEVRGGRVCAIKPMLTAHSLKDDNVWWNFAAHYRRAYDRGEGEALEAPFRNFTPPTTDFPPGFWMEDEESWFPGRRLGGGKAWSWHPGFLLF